MPPGPNAIATRVRSPVACRTCVGSSLAAGVALLLAGPVSAQSGEEILRTALDRHEQRMEGIEDYTLLQTVNGMSLTMFFERVETDGGDSRFRHVPAPELMARQRGEDEGSASNSELAGATAQNSSVDPYAMFEELAPRARLEGSETVGDHEAYLIAVDDLSGIDLGTAMEGVEDSGVSMEPQSMRIWLDQDRYVPLRYTMTGVIQRDGQTSEMTFHGRMSDYREVDGMLYPFRTEMEAQGLGAMLSAEDRERMEEAMAQMESRLEGMDEDQRAMFERMMKDRMPDMEALSGSGSFDSTVLVDQLRVNAGAPENAGIPRTPGGR